MIIHSPGAVQIVVPYSLQICGHIAGAGAGNEQIAAELIVQLFQLIVRHAFLIISQTLVSRQIRAIFLRIELQANPVEKGGVVVFMVPVQFIISFL